jgi:hypothetical protein
MASCKTYAPYVLVLSLFVCNNNTFAHFDKLTPQSRVQIMRDTAFVSLAAAAVSGSLAVYSDISAQKPKGKETAWQKLKRVDWKQVAKVSIGTGAAGALITSIYCYNNAPEWAYNALVDRYSALKIKLQMFTSDPVIQGLMQDNQQELNNACAQESFAVVAAFNYLNKTISSCTEWQKYSENERALIKQNVQALTQCQIPEVAKKAGELFAELNSNISGNYLNSCKSKLQGWIMHIRNSPMYVLELEKTTLLESHAATAAAATKTAAAKELAAHAQQKMATAEQTKATAQLIAAQAKLAQARK